MVFRVPIESRVKTLSSIINKDNRKPLKIESIVDLDDYVGIRLIMLFKRDVEKVISCLKEHFIILKQENKLDELDEDRFGYQSHHYVIQPPEEWLRVPSFSDFKNMKVEVQIRTLSQHIWAAASHKLQYKKKSKVFHFLLGEQLIEYLLCLKSLISNLKECYQSVRGMLRQAD
ncbi:hypothetical protein HHJ54_16210 [Escherichia coli]|nr:hypothetical protein HHJ54_16210 [Escherichia coli]